MAIDDEVGEEEKWPAIFAAREEILFWRAAVVVGRVGEASLDEVEENADVRIRRQLGLAVWRHRRREMRWEISGGMRLTGDLILFSPANLVENCT